MQRVQNFGSLLQSYALKEMLEHLGHTVSFLDIEPNPQENGLLCGKRNVFQNEGESSKTLLSKLKKLDKYTVNRLRIKLRSKRQDAEFEKFRINELGIGPGANSERYDCCVIGSDEVFNCLAGASWGFTSQLFGNVPQADRVITYAASCGATVYENVPETVAARIQDAFGRVAAFSVRDENTRCFVSRLADQPIEEHLDPVLVGDFKEEVKSAKLPTGLPVRYCIVYSYYNRFCNEQDISQIKQFCETNDLELVTVGAPQMWIRNHLVLSPFEVLKAFQNAAFVITDTFHGTIFSAKYANRFAIMVRASNEKKLGDLIGKLGLEEHVVDSTTQLEAVFALEHDLEITGRITKQAREESMRYLRESIEGNKQ